MVKGKSNLPDSPRSKYLILETDEQRESYLDPIRGEILRILITGQRDVDLRVEEREEKTKSGKTIIHSSKIKKPITRYWMTPLEILEKLKEGESGIGISRYTCYYHLHKLQEQGFIEQHPPPLEKGKTRKKTVRGMFFRAIAKKYVPFETEQLLRESEERYRSVFDNTLTGVARISLKDGKTIFCNEAAAHIVGYDTVEEAIEDYITGEHFVDPEIRERMIQEALEAGGKIQFIAELTKRNGDPFWLHTSTTISEEEGYADTTFIDITESKQVEENLRKSEEKYRNLIEQMHDGYLVLQDGKVAFANKIIADIFGYTLNEFIGVPLPDLVAPEDLEMISDRYQRRLAGEPLKEKYDVRAVRKDGTRFIGLIGGFPIEFNGKPATFTTLVDVTERRKFEQETQYLASLVENVSDAIISTDEKFIIRSWNRTAEEIYGWKAEEVIGKPLIDLLESEILGDTVDDSSTSLFETGNWTREAVQKTKDGGRVNIMSSVSLLRDKDGNPQGAVAVNSDISKRVHTEKALRESEDKFKRTFNESPTGIEILDESGCIIDINPAAMRIFGVTDTEQLIGFNVLEDPNTSEIVKDRIRQRKPYRFESTFSFDLLKEKDLYNSSKVGIIFLESLITPLGSQNNPFPSGTMIQFQDVTNSKMAEQVLRESEERWRSFTQEFPDHITSIDSDFVIQFVNRPSEGLTLENLIGRSILDFLPDDQVEDVRSILTELMQSGKPITYYTIYYSPTNSAIHYETRAMPRFINNKIVGALLSSRDITDRKRAEERIQYQANLLQNLSDAVMSTNLSFKIESWNNAAEELYGWKSEDVVGQDIRQLLPNDYVETANNKVNDELYSTGIWRGQIIQTNKDGLKLNVLSSMSYLLDVTGKRAGVVYVNRDITDLIDSQRNLQSERDRAMLYLDLMGHDIRNKLQGITIGLEIIETNIKDNEMLSIFSDIQTAADQCSRIISTVKRTENLTNVVLESRDLSQVVLESIEKLFGNGIDPTIEVTNSAHSTQILADRFLNDLISSLLENAVLHNNKKTKKVWVNIQTNNDSVVLSIADNGPGISDDRKKELFDKTRRYGGVGLHQVKQIVDKYGGKIVVQDRVAGVQSEGVKFDVWFPSFNINSEKQDRGQ